MQAPEIWMTTLSSSTAASTQAVDPLPWTKPAELRVLWDNLYSMDKESVFLYHHLPAKSNRLESQDAGVIGSQCFPVFAMLLSMISNFRIQAVRASFLGFPAARSRC